MLPTSLSWPIRPIPNPAFSTLLCVAIALRHARQQTTLGMDGGGQIKANGVEVFVDHLEIVPAAVMSSAKIKSSFEGRNHAFLEDVQSTSNMMRGPGW